MIRLNNTSFFLRPFLIKGDDAEFFGFRDLGDMEAGRLQKGEKIFMISCMTTKQSYFIKPGEIDAYGTRFDVFSKDGKHLGNNEEGITIYGLTEDETMLLEEEIDEKCLEIETKLKCRMEYGVNPDILCTSITRQEFTEVLNLMENKWNVCPKLMAKLMVR